MIITVNNVMFVLVKSYKVVMLEVLVVWLLTVNEPHTIYTLNLTLLGIL